MNMDIYESVYAAENRYLSQLAAKCGAAAAEAKSAKQAAKAVYKLLQAEAKAQGQLDSEVRLIAPGEPSYLGEKDCWIVTWEAGPYEWAIPASFDIGGAWGHAEPYYNFDLMFYQEQ